MWSHGLKSHTDSMLGDKLQVGSEGTGHPHCLMSEHSWGSGALAGGSGGVSVGMRVILQFALFTVV